MSNKKAKIYVTKRWNYNQTLVYWILSTNYLWHTWMGYWGPYSKKRRRKCGSLLQFSQLLKHSISLFIENETNSILRSKRRNVCEIKCWKLSGKQKQKQKSINFSTVQGRQKSILKTKLVQEIKTKKNN